MKKVKLYSERLDYYLLKFLKFGLILLIIGIPAYPKFPIFNVPGTYVSIRAEDFLIGVISGVWILYMRDKWRNLWRLNIIRAMSLFLTIGAVSSLSALLLTHTGSPLQIMLHTFRRWEYLIGLPIIVSVIKTRKEAFFYFRIMLLTIFIVLVYGLGQKFLDWPIISTMNKEYSQGIAQAIMPGARINSTFAGHYDLAAYGVMMMSLLFGFMAGSKFWSSRVYLLLLIIGNGWLLIVSASRISFAAYMGSILLTMVLLRKWLWILPVMTLSTLAFFQTPALIDRYAETIKYEFLPRLAKLEWHWGETKTETTIASIPTPTPVQTDNKKPTGGAIVNLKPVATVTPSPTPNAKSIAGTQLQYVAPPEDRSTAIRFNVEWPRAIRAWMKNPILGTGYSSITLATDNDYLRALGETGLLGLFTFGLLLFSIFIESIKYLKKRWHKPEGAIVIGYLGAASGFMANALFIDVFEASKVAIYFWILTGLFIAFITINEKLNYETK